MSCSLYLCFSPLQRCSLNFADANTMYVGLKQAQRLEANLSRLHTRHSGPSGAMRRLIHDALASCCSHRCGEAFKGTGEPGSIQFLHVLGANRKRKLNWILNTTVLSLLTTRTEDQGSTVIFLKSLKKEARPTSAELVIWFCPGECRRLSSLNWNHARYLLAVHGCAFHGLNRSQIKITKQ